MESTVVLVSQALAGDPDAFARLIGPEQAVALRVAYAIAGSDAEDVVQDAFVKAFTRLGQFRTDAAFRPWVLAIVANEARNRRRSSARRVALALRTADREAGAPVDPATDVVSAAAREQLLGAVSALPDRDREIVALRYFAELSEAETATALGCPVGTVKSRLSRALTRLRAELGEELRS